MFKRIIPKKLSKLQLAAFDRSGLTYHATSTESWLSFGIIYEDVYRTWQSQEDVVKEDMGIPTREIVLKELFNLLSVNMIKIKTRK